MCGTDHYELVLAAMVTEAKIDGRRAGAHPSPGEACLVDRRLEELDRVGAERRIVCEVGSPRSPQKAKIRLQTMPAAMQ